jgi:hypothetical protein
VSFLHDANDANDLNYKHGLLQKRGIKKCEKREKKAPFIGEEVVTPFFMVVTPSSWR